MACKARNPQEKITHYFNYFCDIVNRHCSLVKTGESVLDFTLRWSVWKQDWDKLMD